MSEIVALLLAGCLIGWWCEITAKVEVGSIRELYLGENHPLNHQVVRIAHKGFLCWSVYTQRCVRGYTENDGQLVTMKGSDERGTVANYGVVKGFTEDSIRVDIPIWLIRAVLEPQMRNAETERMRYVSDVPNESLNSWYTEA